ncbi:centromere protein X-like [Eriocheir sinensis]|uniref:centromere protein X-like n=1 Tax=Eriocheir sinensis TaxID=95602 RepID=UPI0021C9B07D|nr:centromere protein X-like [Eriocheir sinensis]XP_050688103.1 centromere protein X-like [Eriocheir sinensis]XP_050688104.1 centromere protein X-like [Eriocheir sinensis]XP_050688105.1 centromere protein X-like [Eriocheir sinensis]
MKFSDRLIREFFNTHFENSKTKINSDAMVLIAEVLKLLVMEGAMRTAHQAKQEGSDTVTLEHLEKILSQLILDFS